MLAYQSKNEEYLECLKKIRKSDNKTQNNSVPSQAIEGNFEEDTTIEFILRKLRLHEFERDLSNLRGLISSIIIPKLMVLEASEVS